MYGGFFEYRPILEHTRSGNASSGTRDLFAPEPDCPVERLEFSADALL